MSLFSNVASKFVAGSQAFVSKTTGAKILTLDHTTGRLIETLGVADIDAQNGTLTAARVASGIIVHTSVTGAGTLTFDTGPNYDTAFPSVEVGDCIRFYIVNDGDQTVTLAADAGPTITLADSGQTIAANESAVILLRKTATGLYTAYTFGA